MQKKRKLKVRISPLFGEDGKMVTGNREKAELPNPHLASGDDSTIAMVMSTPEIKFNAGMTGRISSIEGIKVSVFNSEVKNTQTLLT